MHKRYILNTYCGERGSEGGSTAQLLQIVKTLVYCDKLLCFGKTDPGEIFVRGRIRRYSRAEIEEAIEVERAQEMGGPRLYQRAEIKRQEAEAIQETGGPRREVRRQ